MPAPSISPVARDPGDIAAAASYRPGEAVWIHRGSWRPGVVLGASSRAVIVRYRYQGRAVGVDTVLANCVARRDEHDPIIDATIQLPTAAR
ncbi:hypothetical protein [Micromonospora globbae]|uniref:hypothetical protein n=1 Tax=Micromonospora globbae TaxID=1894969 RepID=UPI0038689FFB|nr:hypothetical protein OH732_01240 [Micromonospora globbae]